MLENTQESLVDFFNVNFPGISPELISPESLREQFESNPHLPLISLKCTPHHFDSNVVILGDAAHAVLPFYGQGLNAGLEDVRILFELLDKHGVYSEGNKNDYQRINELRAISLEAYTQQRTPDARAINDLSKQNYVEMRWGVKSPLYRLRKSLEETLSRYIPALGWSTQYARISFGNQRYSEVVMATERQTRVLTRATGTMLVTVVGFAGVWMWRWRHLRDLAARMLDSSSLMG